jgi:tight adherence protein C
MIIAILSVLVAGSAFVALSASRSKPVGVRLKTLHDLRDRELAALYAEDSEYALNKDDEKPFFEQVIEVYKKLIEPLPIFGKADQEKMARLLNTAGIRAPEAIGLFITLKVAVAIFGALAAYAAMTLLGYFEDSVVMQGATVCAGFIGGSLLPEAGIKHWGARRQGRLIMALPDALDLMVICAEAGLSLDLTVERVANEIDIAAPDLADELAATVSDLKMLPDRTQALENLAKRADVRPVRSLVATLIQTQKYGTSLAQSLRVLAQETRNARMLAIEEKAARLPALLSMPLILFILPSVFIVLTGPAIINTMRTFS